jgi:FtsH-binding integral membrane protein
MRDGNSAVSLFELSVGEINAELQTHRRNESVNDKGGQDPDQPQQTKRMASRIWNIISGIVLSLCIALFVISIIISVFLRKEYGDLAWLGSVVFCILPFMIWFLICIDARSEEALFFCCPGSAIISALVVGMIYFISRGLSMRYIIGTTGAFMGCMAGVLFSWLFYKIITSKRGRIIAGIITGVIIGIVSGILSGLLIL